MFGAFGKAMTTLVGLTFVSQAALRRRH